MTQGDGSILIRGARIFWLNFAGREGKYNAEGDRNFCVELPEDIAEQMAADGWPVKTREVRDEGDTPAPFVSVRVNYGAVHKPRIFLVSTRNGERYKRTLLDEDTIELIDSMDIANVDLIMRPYEWEVRGQTGIKPYLKSLYVTIVEDELEVEYSVLDDRVSTEED